MMTASEIKTSLVALQADFAREAVDCKRFAEISPKGARRGYYQGRESQAWIAWSKVFQLLSDINDSIDAPLAITGEAMMEGVGLLPDEWIPLAGQDEQDQGATGMLGVDPVVDGIEGAK
jgi:hypothetical protein